MNKTILKSVLSNSAFAETVNPYQIFIDEDKKLIAIANSFSTQWSGRDVSMYSNFLVLYNLDTLALIGFVDNLIYSINDLSFHPAEESIAIGIGQYDGGAYFEGELLFWNYKTNELKSVLAEEREVTKCAFSKDGKKVTFTVMPTDDLDTTDYTNKVYEIDFPALNKISLESLNPISVTDYIDNFDYEEYKNRLRNSEKVLTEIAARRNERYINKSLVWDITFIKKQEIAVARSNATVEIWNIETGEVKDVKLPSNGNCVEVFFNSSNNSLLVNLWSREFQSDNTNKLFAITLSTLEVKHVIDCQHTLSKSKDNYFLARQIDHSDKTKKDFILNANYEVVFEKRLGHYDLFNHYLRIDNGELLYCLLGKPKEQHQNKMLWSIEPKNFEVKQVWQLEKQPNHYNNLNGIKENRNLILSGKVYASNVNPYGAQELFSIDLMDKSEKWSRTVDSQVCSFGIIDNGATVVLALANGRVELIESATGKTVETINRSNSWSSARPLSIATFDNTIAVGLTSGQIEIYTR